MSIAIANYFYGGKEKPAVAGLWNSYRRCFRWRSIASVLVANNGVGISSTVHSIGNGLVAKPGCRLVPVIPVSRLPVGDSRVSNRIGGLAPIVAGVEVASLDLSRITHPADCVVVPALVCAGLEII